MRWAFRDSKLNFTATIPNLVVDANPVERPATELEARMQQRLEDLALRWKMNLRIYDSVEGSSESGSRYSVSTSGDTSSNATNDIDTNDDIARTIWHACYAEGRRRRGQNLGYPYSTSSSFSSSASFQPGSSIDNSLSSYSCSTSSTTIGTNTPSSSASSNTLLPTSVRYTHPLPTLYGIIISHTVVAIVAYDPNSTATYSSLSPNTISPTFQSLPHQKLSSSAAAAASPLIPPCLRTVSFFDLGDPSYDVWNALALAIVVVHCRNALLDLVVEGVDVEDVGRGRVREGFGDEREGTVM